MTIPAPLPSNETIAAALRANDFQRVEALADQRLLALPDDPSAQVLLGIALTQLKRPTEAVTVYRNLIACQPQEPTHYFNLGSLLRATNNLDEAEQAYRHGIALNPEDAGALADLGMVRWQRGDSFETMELMLKAWRIDPDLPEPRIYGASACYECAKTEMAEQLLQGCEHWPFLGPEMEGELALVLMHLDRVVEAERRLQLLLRLPQAEHLAYVRLAILMERVNKLDEAEAILPKISNDEQQSIEGLLIAAKIDARRGRFDEAKVSLKRIVEKADTDSVKVKAMFSLANAYHATGASDQAMNWLKKAHEQQMVQVAMSAPNLIEPGANPLNIVDYRVSQIDYEQWCIDPSAPTADESPIFIVGFPRSGTTLLEQMLDAHPGLRAMDERAFLQNTISRMQEWGTLEYPDDLHRLGPSDLANLRELYWLRVKGVVNLRDGEQLIDKNPLNLLRLPMLHRLFPNARIVLALRHPCDVLLSNYLQCFRSPAFQALCSSFEKLALGYSDAMAFWIHHAELFNPNVLELRYEDLVGNFGRSVGDVAKHLALCNADALANFQSRAREKGFISTPSYSQVVEPINQKAVGRWESYREYLEPVLPQLKPAMEHWGYQA